MTPEQFFSNFELFTAAPGGIRRLRELILQLAVQGKLVPEDGADEPASVLLKKINEEKARLTQDDNAKKRQCYPDPGRSAVPYQLPDSWIWTRFGDLTLSIESGWSPRCENRPRTGAEWGVLKVSAVSWGIFKPSENKALPPGVQPRPKCEVKVNDFLMSRANTAELVGKSVVVQETSARLMLSDKLLRVTLSQFVDNHFLNLVNNSLACRSYYASTASGTSVSMRNISREQIARMPVPLAPLSVAEHRIVSTLDRHMALCDELESALKQAEGVSERLSAAAIHQLLAATDNICAVPDSAV